MNFLGLKRYSKRDDFLPGGAEIPVVVVEAAGAVVAFAEVFNQGFEVFWLQVAGDGLGSFTGDNDDGGGEFQLPVGKIQGELVAAVLRAEGIAPALPIDGSVAFGVDLDGIELFVKVLSDGPVGICFFIHLF